MRPIDADRLTEKILTTTFTEGNSAILNLVLGFIKDMPTVKPEKPNKRESRAMLPCKCGGVRREHWYGIDTELLVCKRCGFKVVGKNSADAIRKWNEAVKQDETNRAV